MVSVLIPGDESEKFLLTNYGEKGWFLPFGNVDKSETVKVAACRIAAEVSCFASEMISQSTSVYGGRNLTLNFALCSSIPMHFRQ